MFRRSPAFAALTALLLVVPAAEAQQQSEKGFPKKPGFGFVFEGGFEFGGEEVVELQFTNGDTQKLTAGQGGTIGVGFDYRFAKVPRLSLAGTVNYKFVTNASENASIGITRVPVEVVGRWDLNDAWWIGAGLVKHNSVNVNGDGFFPDVTLESSVGPTLELGWKWVALTYTSLQYTAPDDTKFGAGAVGISFRYVTSGSR